MMNVSVRLRLLVFFGLLNSVISLEPTWQINYSEDGNIEFSKESTAHQISIQGLQQNRTQSRECDTENSYVFCREWENAKVRASIVWTCTWTETKINYPNGVGPGPWLLTQYHFTGNLYGGPEQARQYWPLNDVTFENYSYVTKEEDHQAIAERYWLTSEGTFYYIKPEAPFFLQQNVLSNGSLEFIYQNRPPYPSPRLMIINETTCEYDNAKIAHLKAVEMFLKKPKDIPDETMIIYPIWSTWAQYKDEINQEKVLKFAKQIIEKGFKNSQIEIDDKWETCYGSLTFDTTRFPNMKGLSESLKKLDFRVTLWVHPFINTDCSPFYEEAVEKGYLVKNTEGSTQTKWWNGEAGIIDVTNPQAVAWWTQRLTKVMVDNGIDSLKFDAGETSWLPQVPLLTGDLMQQPNSYTKKFVETASRYGKMIEVRVGFQTQEYPIFVRMLDLDSRWGFDNGLPTLVTTLLQMNLAGYPFVLPDMVGGNGYEPDGPPSKELFIRWLQANVFMPAIQYSFVPWNYDDETVEICKKYTELHEKYAKIIIEAMKNATIDGTPVNPPIWWIDPKDKEALTINDEYLLGEVLLAAPVLTEGAVSRDIYLPKGVWQDKLRGGTIEGPVWLRNYSVALNELAYFELGHGSAGTNTIEIFCLVACILTLFYI